jgi:hypothetical protein
MQGLPGEQGPTGDTGPCGAEGAAGISAYELAIQSGFTGTLCDWLASLRGPSVYDLAVANGFKGSLDDWLASLCNNSGQSRGSCNANLSGLSVNPTTMTPMFNSEILDYVVNVPNDVSVITINAIAEDPCARISGTGTKKLQVGNNVLSITVIPEDKYASVKVYTIAVFRSEPLNNNANLSCLSVCGYHIVPAFHVNNTKYALSIANHDASVMIVATAEDSRSVISGTGIHNLCVGCNSINIIVTAEDGTQKVYTIAITRTTQ